MIQERVNGLFSVVLVRKLVIEQMRLKSFSVGHTSLNILNHYSLMKLDFATFAEKMSCSLGFGLNTAVSCPKSLLLS